MTENPTVGILTVSATAGWGDCDCPARLCLLGLGGEEGRPDPPRWLDGERGEPGRGFEWEEEEAVEWSSLDLLEFGGVEGEVA